MKHNWRENVEQHNGQLELCKSRNIPLARLGNILCHHQVSQEIQRPVHV